MKELIQQGIDGGVFESTMLANGRLSQWNSRIVLVDKPGSKPGDEPRLAFDYSRLKEQAPASCMERAPKVHDYLGNPLHRCLFKADLKHVYFKVELHPDDRHIFAFTVPGFGQLQPTRMPQGSGSASFTMTELMNIAFGQIPPPDAERSLLTLSDPPPLAFYLDDIFGGYPNFEAQYAFLRDHFLPRIAWARLRLSFSKLSLFQESIVALGIEHYTLGRLKIREERVGKIMNWPTPKDTTEVRRFLGALGIVKRWVKNFAELARPLQRLTGNVEFEWSRCAQLSFDLLKIKGASQSLLHGIDWDRELHMYTDASKFGAGCVVTQFQTAAEADTLVEVPILHDAFTFSKPERNYGTYKRELCAIIRFCQKYSYML